MVYSSSCLGFTMFVILRLLVSLLCVSSASAIAVSSNRPCHFPAIFNFGDSNSDTGGFSAAFRQTLPPNGESYFGAPAGRYSDGRLIIDFIAEKLQLPFLSAYLDVVGSNFSHGANFATAGSMIEPQNTKLSDLGGFSPVSLVVQFNQYAQFITRSQTARQQGKVFRELLPKQKDFSHALYTFDIGQNDLVAAYYLNMSTEQVRDHVPHILNGFSQTIKNIYDQGGKYFWIHNTGPFGCLPNILDQFVTNTTKFDKVGCATTFNDVAQYFNLRLHEVVAQLREDLPSAAFTYIDVYSIKYTLLSQAKKHGFEQPLRACFGHDGKSCKDPKVRINWDGVHYTEAANKFVFNGIVDGSFSDPPIPLDMACHRPSKYV